MFFVPTQHPRSPSPVSFCFSLQENKSISRVLEENYQFAAGLSQEEKNSKAQTFIRSQIYQVKSEIEKAMKYPDCTELQKGEGQ